MGSVELSTGCTELMVRGIEAGTRPMVAAVTTAGVYKAVQWLGWSVSIAPLALATIISSIAVALIQPDDKEKDYVLTEVIRGAVALTIGAIAYVLYGSIPVTFAAIATSLVVYAASYLAARAAYTGIRSLI